METSFMKKAFFVNLNSIFSKRILEFKIPFKIKTKNPNINENAVYLMHNAGV